MNDKTETYVSIPVGVLETLTDAASCWLTELNDYVLPEAAKHSDEDAEYYHAEILNIEAAITAASKEN